MNTDTGLGDNATVQNPNAKNADGSLKTGKDSLGGGAGIGYGHDSDEDKSVTVSGINTANVIITDEAGQQKLTGRSGAETIAALHTDITTNTAAAHSGALENNFDKDALQRELALQVAVTQEFSQNWQEARAELNGRLDAIKAQHERGEISQSEYDERTASLKRWGLALDTVAAGLYAPSGSLGGSLAAAASPAAAQAIGDYFKEQAAKNKLAGLDGLTAGQQTAHVLAHAVLGAAVAAAGGNDALTAGLAAGGAEAAAPALSKWLYGTDDPEKLTAQQKATVGTIAGLAGNAIGGVAGSTPADSVAAGMAARNAVDNNLLTLKNILYLNNMRQMAPAEDKKALDEAKAKEHRELAQAAYDCLVNKSHCDSPVLENELGEKIQAALESQCKATGECLPEWYLKDDVFETSEKKKITNKLIEHAVAEVLETEQETLKRGLEAKQAEYNAAYQKLNAALCPPARQCLTESSLLNAKLDDATIQLSNDLLSLNREITDIRRSLGELGDILMFRMDPPLQRVYPELFVLGGLSVSGLKAVPSNWKIAGAGIGAVASATAQLTFNEDGTPIDYSAILTSGALGYLSVGQGFGKALSINTTGWAINASLTGGDPVSAAGWAAVGTAIGYPIGVKVANAVSAASSPLHQFPLYFPQNWPVTNFGVMGFKLPPPTTLGTMVGTGASDVLQEASPSVLKGVAGQEK
jgi:hypothetical protein